MTLVSTSGLVEQAVHHQYGLLAFNVVTLEHIEAVVDAGQAAGRTVIIQVSENAVAFHNGRIHPLTCAARSLAEESTAPVSLHLDHVTNPELLRQAADAGFSSVMFDGSALPYQDNVAATRRAAEWAHGAGLMIEAELGFVGGKGGQPASAHAAGVRTNPDEAAVFVTATDVDMLAVAVGSSHAMRERNARIDQPLIRRLSDAVPVPLVLHGSSGVPPEQLRLAVKHGIVKINIGTALGIAYTQAVRKRLADDPELVDPRIFISDARAAMRAAVTEALEAIRAPNTPRGDSSHRSD